MYIWNIELVEKVRISSWVILWTLFACAGLVSFYGGSEYSVSILVVVALMRFTHSAFVEHKKQLSDPGIAPHTEVRDAGLFVSQGKGKYQVEIPYAGIEVVNYLNLYGFNKLALSLSNNRKLNIWNMKNAKELCAAIREKT